MAVDKCHEAMARFKDSYGAKECEALEDNIKFKKMSLTLELANNIDKPFRGYLSYTNIAKLYVRVIPVDFEAYHDHEYYYTDRQTFLKKYIKMTPTKKWDVKLPDDGDFQTHYTEIKMPELNEGYYLVLLSTDSNFALSNNGIAYATTWVSNLSFIDRKTDDNGNNGYEFYVQNRESGNPEKGVTANLWGQTYNYTTRKYDYIKYDSKITDDEGHVSFQTTKKDGMYFDIELIKGKDRFRSDNYYSLYMYNYGARANLLWSRKPYCLLTGEYTGRGRQFTLKVLCTAPMARTMK